MSNITVYVTFEQAVEDGIVSQLHSGGASLMDFNLEKLSKRIVKPTNEGYVINPKMSFWEVAEECAV